MQAQFQSNNYRLLSLLVGYEEFQTYVKGVRDFLDIAEKGYKNNKEVEKWTHDRDKKDFEYRNSKEYKNQSQNIRAKVQRGEIGIDMASKHMGLMDIKLRSNYFTSACRYVVDTFNLPSHLADAIRYYILYDKLIFVPTENFAYIPDIYNDRVARIEVYSNLTKEEGKSLLHLVSELGKKFPKIDKISDTTMKRLSFEDWHKNRNNYSEKMTAKDIAKEHFRSGSKRQRVYDAKRGLDRKRKKLFGKKGF